MADDNYGTQDDGEYHFSDDQANYEAEPEVTASPTAAPPSGPKVNPLEQLKPYKKPIIAFVVVFILFFGFKLVQPSSPAKPAELVAIADTTPPQPLLEQKPIPVTPPVPAVPVEAPLPAAVVVNSTPTVPAPLTPAPPAPAPTVTVVQAAAPSSSSEQSSDNGNQKVIALETETAKAQTETTQKMADYEAQNAVLQNKIQELNTRLAGMETTLNQVSQMLKDKPSAAPAPLPVSAAPNVINITPPPFMAKPVEPKTNYSVQAIIPGRAWLKSDAGDTVTVAEGDNIKEFGRVVKIDPYDGIVQVDMGTQIVSLSYGVSSN